MAVTYNIKGTSQSSFKVGKGGAGTVEIGGIDASGAVSSTASITGHLVPSANITYDLGTSSLMWRDLYVGPGSIYVNGKKVIEDNAGTINITTDENQNLTIATSGTGETTMSSAAGLNFSTTSTGDITFTTATGQIEFDGDVIVNAAKSISSSNADPITFADPISVTGNSEMANLTVTGNLTVQGTTTTIDSTTVQIQNAFVFEGATDDAYETTLTVTDPTADRTITLPDATGTVALTSDLTSYITASSTDTLTNKTLTSPILTTPSLSGNLSVPDNSRILVGTGDDLQIYHNGTSSFIKQDGSSSLRILSSSLLLQNTGGTDTFLEASVAGAVDLYYNNSKKLSTVTGGIDVTGRGQFTGTGVSAGIVLDNSTFGTYNWQEYQADDGKLTWTVSGTGGAEMQLTSDGADYSNAVLNIGGNPAVTTAGERAMTSWLRFTDGSELRLGTDDDLIMYQDSGSTAAFIHKQTSGDLYVKANNNLYLQAGTSQPKVHGIAGGAVELYYSTEGKKFETTSSGATVTGGLNVAGTPSAIGNDNIQVDFSAPEGRIQSKNSSASPASNLGFYTTDTGGTTNKIMHLTYDGKVGIGTALPERALHLSASVPIIRGTDTDTSSYGEISFSGGSVDIRADEGNAAAGSYIVFRNDGSEIARFDSNGRLGIGTITPAYALDVTGDGAFSGNVTVTGNLTVNGTTTTVNSTEVNVQNAFVFEGATDDGFETTLTVTDPTADRTITLPDATGTVVIKDSNTGAIQLPVGTTAQRPASPSVGMVRYNTTTSHFEGYDGSAWVHLETQYG